MTTPTSTPRRAPAAVALLTLLWLLGAAALVFWWFAIGLEGWADHHGNQGARADELAMRGARVTLAAAVVLVGGPLVIAVVAFAGSLRWTGAVFCALALLAGAVAVPVAAGAARTLIPPPAPVPAPTVCQEHSGGDTRCPGG